MENGGMRDAVDCETPRRFSFRDLLTRRSAPENRIGIYLKSTKPGCKSVLSVYTHTYIYIKRETE